ncbi:hypothetical protein ABMA32_03665 [Mesorhizobium sp. VNQ89]|uniref:hypothetical protein n=1 Tax=Mesorhizobium quangtriensis TaxID=3157709 RepID=UPI0032B87DD4
MKQPNANLQKPRFDAVGLAIMISGVTCIAYVDIDGASWAGKFRERPRHARSWTRERNP